MKLSREEAEKKIAEKFTKAEIDELKDALTPVAPKNIDPDRYRVAKFCIGDRIQLHKWAFQKMIEGLPDDAVLLAIRHDPEKLMSYLFIQSEKFPKIAEGEVPPEIVCNINGMDKTVKLHLPEVGGFMNDLAGL